MGRKVNNKEKIFVIDDNEDTTKMIALNLEAEGMQVSTFCIAEDALMEVRTKGTPDLFILDLNLPKMSGFQFLKLIRKKYRPTIPVIIISSEETTNDLIKSIDLGADVFVRKPLSPRILIAQVRACLRRFAIYSAATEEAIIFDDYVLLLNTNILKKGKYKIALSAIEYGVLEFLIMNAGVSMLPERIYTEVWKAPFGDMTAVAVYIQRLRKKIEADPSHPRYIKTDFGKGYFFNEATIYSNYLGSSKQYADIDDEDEADEENQASQDDDEAGEEAEGASEAEEAGENIEETSGEAALPLSHPAKKARSKKNSKKEA